MNQTKRHKLLDRIPIVSTTQDEDERNAIAWLSLTDQELQDHGLLRSEADYYAIQTVGHSAFVDAWIKENR